MEPLTTDPATLMNVGIILGAFAAATLAGKFTFEWRLPIRQWIGAILGGLHIWLWILCAFFGSIVGVWTRPLFKLD